MNKNKIIKNLGLGLGLVGAFACAIPSSANESRENITSTTSIETEDTSDKEVRIGRMSVHEMRSLTYDACEEVQIDMYSKIDNLNARTGRSTSFSSYYKLQKGERVTRLALDQDGWTLVCIPLEDSTDYMALYVATKYLTPATSEVSSEDDQKVSYKYVTANSSLNVRKGPGTSHSKIGGLKRATKVKVISEKNGWSYIQSGSLKGYVSSKYLADKMTSNSTLKKGQYVIIKDNVDLRRIDNPHKFSGVLQKGDVIELTDSDDEILMSEILHSYRVISAKDKSLVGTEHFIGSEGTSYGAYRCFEHITLHGEPGSLSVISNLSPGDRFNPISDKPVYVGNTKWLKVKMSDGKIGYLDIDYTTYCDPAIRGIYRSAAGPYVETECDSHTGAFLPCCVF